MSPEERADAVLTKHESEAMRGSPMSAWLSMKDRIAAAIRAAENEALERASRAASSWQSPDAIKLAAGEMTAQELRTAQATAGGIERAIRALKHPE